MSEDPEDVIAALRRRLNAKTDTELARKLGINKSTISTWKTRGSVPKRFLAIRDGASHEAINSPPLGWGDHENMAFNLAVSRAMRALNWVMSQGSYSDLLTVFSTSAWLWVLMHEAQQELTHRQDERGVDLGTAFSMALHDDFATPEAAAERDRAAIRGMFGFVDGEPVAPF